MNIAICDSSSGYREILRLAVENSMKRREMSHEILLFATGKELLDSVPSEIDICFLNLEQGQNDGIRVARELTYQNLHCVIILFSNDVQCAKEGYEIGAIRYLLKSEIGADKFEEAIDAAVAALFRGQDILEIKSFAEPIVIPISAILYMERKLRKITIVTLAKHYECYGKLEYFGRLLASRQFNYSHRSYLVNLKKVKFIIRNEIVLEGGKTIPLSRSRAQQFKRYFYLQQEQTLLSKLEAELQANL